MNKRDITLLKKHLKLENSAISNVCGCMVNANGEKIFDFKENFLNRSDDDAEKYLKLIKKVFSNKIGDNTMMTGFTTQEETAGEHYDMLKRLRETKLGDENLLNDFYDKVIETADFSENYLILLFHDTYDIPGEEDSLDVHEFITCLFCPMKLSADVLGYDSVDQQIAKVPRANIVNAPVAGFSFPAFSDKETDMHSIILYSKKAKEPETEFLCDVTGCEYKRTATQKRIEIANQMAFAFGEETEDIAAKFMKELYLRYEIEENAKMELTVRLIGEVLDEIYGKRKEETDMFLEAFNKSFDNESVFVSEIIDLAMVEKANAMERKERLRILLDQCVKQIENTSGANDVTEEIKASFLK